MKTENHAVDRAKRIADIEGWLNAHSQGWTSLDRADIAQMKNELNHLKQADAPTSQTSGPQP